jgi:hypothetical protein
MDDLEYIARPVWRWLVDTPIWIATAYNLHRQEINPGALPALNGLDGISWVTGLLVALLVASLIVIAGLLRYVRNLKATVKKQPSVISEAKTGQVSDVGTVYGRLTQQQGSQTNDKQEPPEIVVGFLGEGGEISQTLNLQVQPVPEKPNIEERVHQKRIELLEKKRTFESETPTPGEGKTELERTMSLAMFYSINTYEKRIEEYLNEYRGYLEDADTFSLINDRYVRLEPIIRSNSPVSSVKLEVMVPEAFPFPTWNAYHLREIYQRTGGHFEDSSEPIEPEVFDDAAPTMQIPYSYNLPDSSHARNEIFFDDLDVEKRKNMYLVKYHIDGLIPFQNEALHPIDVWLGSISQPMSWDIPVKVYAKGLNPSVERHLKVNILMPGL